MPYGAVLCCRYSVRYEAGCCCPAHRPSPSQARDSHWLPVPPTVSPLPLVAGHASFCPHLCYDARYEADRQQKSSSGSSIKHLASSSVGLALREKGCLLKQCKRLGVDSWALEPSQPALQEAPEAMQSMLVWHTQRCNVHVPGQLPKARPII